MVLAGYARTSTAEQDTALQPDALHTAVCERVFAVMVSEAMVYRSYLTPTQRASIS